MPEPEVLVEGIKRLEYRGYDSWGLCLASEDQLSLLRRVGRIGGVDGAALGAAAAAGAAGAGIAHTRWATHGAPDRGQRASPRRTARGRIAVIHNGIIENHAALRASLLAKGHRFTSETDTEVIPHLIEELLKTEPDFSAAFLAALKLLVGAYGIAALWAGSPDTVYVARHGSPIVLASARTARSWQATRRRWWLTRGT